MGTRKRDAFLQSTQNYVDIVYRPLVVGNIDCRLFYLDGICDTDRIEKNIISPLTKSGIPNGYNRDTILSIISFSGNIKEVDEEGGKKDLFYGNAILFIEDDIFSFPLTKAPSRSISEPPTGNVIKGPREGFVEDIKTNLALLRRKIRTPLLYTEEVVLGKMTETRIYLVYVEGIPPKKTIDRIKKRLQSIEIDGIIDSSYVAKILTHNPYSLLKQVGNSEKVDAVASKILDGRVAILVDGSPIVLTLPFILTEDFDDNQDRYKMPSRVTFLRMVRLFAVFFAILLPASFVAVQSHQYQILPLQLMITILDSTEGVPFSPTLEMLIALLLFEILTEASIRMPRQVSLALSVIGAIVLGQTAVEAGLLSSLTVLVVAISGIGMYTVPDQAGTIGVFRMIFVVVAGAFGIYGILLLTLCFLAYMSELTVYDAPYLSPFAPIESEDLKNDLLKQNITDCYRRPRSFPVNNNIRLKNKRKL